MNVINLAEVRSSRNEAEHAQAADSIDAHIAEIMWAAEAASSGVLPEKIRRALCALTRATADTYGAPRCLAGARGKARKWARGEFLAPPRSAEVVAIASAR